MPTSRSKQYLIRGLLAIAAATALALGASSLLDPAPGPTAGEHAGHQHARQAAPFFEDLLKVYTPRRECMDHEAPVIWLHLVSDLLIGIAYFSIPLALITFVRRRRDLAFNGIFWLFAAFILACGTTHFIGVWDLWQPLYKIDGLVKLATAAVSITTALVLWPLIPKALALPSPAQLEERVERRTQELARANEALRREAAAREEAEAELEHLIESERAARGEAERAVRTKDEFLATLSHELRTPIHAVSGWCQLLRADRSPERFEEGMDVIERNARAQGKLIDDLLDMNRIMSGRFRLDLQEVDLAEVLSTTVESLRPAADARRIRLQKVLDEDAGPVTGDPERLQQVMWNLLSNAVKFTPKGGRVEVRLERVNSHAEVTVVDDGQGIEPELLPHVFERFRQGDASAKRRHGGMGLGLAIVRQIVELHGGTVHARSEGAGKGATFVVALPVRVTRASAQTEPDAPPLGERPLEGVRVLAIEDDADARGLLERFLRDAGAEVATAGSAEEGLAELERARPDVLLCDLGLPGEDGFSLIRRVRQLAPSEGGRVPAVAVTAFARSEDRTRALLAGFQAHVPKPFAPRELTAVIRGLTAIFGERRDG